MSHSAPVYCSVSDSAARQKGIERLLGHNSCGEYMCTVLAHTTNGSDTSGNPTPTQQTHMDNEVYRRPIGEGRHSNSGYLVVAVHHNKEFKKPFLNSLITTIEPALWL